MKALQLHQVMSAMTAIAKPLSVARAVLGREQLGDARAARALAAACFQRSGSLTNRRTMNATAAGTSPHRNT